MSTAISVTSAKSPRRRSKSQKKTDPTVSDLIMSAMSASKERTGVSLAALKKALQAGGYDVVNNKARILNAIRRLVANNSLVQIKGTGASGSFKLNRKPPTPRQKTVVNKKSPKANKDKRASAKEAAGDVAQATIKSPKKKRKAKSPKKGKRPAAAKKPKSPRMAKRSAAAKKPKGPRKAKRRAAKSTRTRAAARK